MKLPDHPSITERYYHIPDANNLVRVVVRNAYAHMGHEQLCNTRLECRWDTGPETAEWRPVPGTVQGLSPRREADERAARIYHGDWRRMLEEAGARNRSTSFAAFLA